MNGQPAAPEGETYPQRYQRLMAQRIRVRNRKTPSIIQVMARHPESGDWFKLGAQHYGVGDERLEEFWEILEWL
jgi:hypothetical protein